MPSKKSASRVASKTSSATTFAASSGTSKPLKSSILKSSFSPAHLQLSLFASVIQSLDSQQLRIHDTLSGRLKSEYSPSRTRINCISWGRYTPDGRNGDSQPAKKRRKHGAATVSDTSPGVVVIAVGTNNERIDFFAPLESRVVTTLAPAHPHGTRAIEFRNDGLHSEAWSLGADGTLMQWDIATGERVRILSTPIESTQAFTLLRASVLVASNSTSLIDLDSSQEKATFPGFEDPIHTLMTPPQVDVQSHAPTFLAAAQDSRYINVYDIKSASLVGNLIADNDIEQVALREELRGEIPSSSPLPLAVVTKDGKVDLFSNPFDGWQAAKSKHGDLKARSKHLTRKAEVSTRVIRPDRTAAPVPILNVLFQHSDLVLALSEGSTDLTFERVPCYDRDGRLSLPPSILHSQTKGFGASTETMNGVKDLGNTHLDEARAVVIHRADLQEHDPADEQEVIEISSADEESADGISDEDQPFQNKPIVNGIRDEDADVTDTVNGEASKQREEGEELSFGDLAQMKSIGTVDVSAALSDANEGRIAPVAEKLDVSTNLSLGTVLSQSLRTNDAGLLESCFRVQDLQIVRATIERLGSDMATTLLQKLAERLHNRPGRAGSLLVWVQWTLVAHGGYLASRPDVVRKLSSLHTVIRERAKSLQPLLSLKGKLDMLEAQINLRKSAQRRNHRPSGQEGTRAPVVYVEGQEESSTGSDEEDPSSPAASHQQRIANDIEDEESTGESEEDVTNAMDVDENEDDDEDSEVEDFVDDKASETDVSHDEDLDEEVDYDDVDSVEENVEESSAVPEAQSSDRFEQMKSRRRR